jgi:hypothetical protein
MATRERIWRVRVLAEISALLASTRTRQNGIFRKYLGLAPANLASIERIWRIWRVWRVWRIWQIWQG